MTKQGNKLKAKIENKYIKDVRLIIEGGDYSIDELRILAKEFATDIKAVYQLDHVLGD